MTETEEKRTIVVNILNALMSFFKEGCKERKLSSLPKDWNGPYRNADMVVFNYEETLSGVKFFKTEKNFNGIRAGFLIHLARFWIEDLDAVFKYLPDIRNHAAFLTELIYSLWTKQSTTLDQLNIFLEKYEAPYAQKITDALHGWIYSSNFEKSGKYGKRLYQYIKYLPKYLRRAPSNILYRAVLLDNSLYEKIQTGEKKILELKNRTYISWSSDIHAAKEFGERYLGHTANVETKTLILLRKKFTKDQIFLNVEEAADYYGIRSVYTSEEKEIIVRISEDVLKFTLKDIYQIYNVKTGKWKKV